MVGNGPAWPFGTKGSNLCAIPALGGSRIPAAITLLMSIVLKRCDASKTKKRNFGNSSIACERRKTRASSINLWQTGAIRAKLPRTKVKWAFPVAAENGHPGKLRARF